MPSDRDLEERFAAERAADERGVPSFARVVSTRSSRAPVSCLRLALAAAFVVAVAVGTWRLMTSNEPVIAFTPGDMRVPTDFLLETMSYPRAGEIPRIGASDLLPTLTADGSDPRRLP